MDFEEEKKSKKLIEILVIAAMIVAEDRIDSSFT